MSPCRSIDAGTSSTPQLRPSTVARPEVHGLGSLREDLRPSTVARPEAVHGLGSVRSDLRPATVARPEAVHGLGSVREDRVTSPKPHRPKLHGSRNALRALQDDNFVKTHANMRRSISALLLETKEKDKRVDQLEAAVRNHCRSTPKLPGQKEEALGVTEEVKSMSQFRQDERNCERIQLVADIITQTHITRPRLLQDSSWVATELWELCEWCAGYWVEDKQHLFDDCVFCNEKSQTIAKLNERLNESIRDSLAEVTRLRDRVAEAHEQLAERKRDSSTDGDKDRRRGAVRMNAQEFNSLCDDNNELYEPLRHLEDETRSLAIDCVEEKVRCILALDPRCFEPKRVYGFVELSKRIEKMDKEIGDQLLEKAKAKVEEEHTKITRQLQRKIDILEISLEGYKEQRLCNESRRGSAKQEAKAETPPRIEDPDGGQIDRQNERQAALMDKLQNLQIELDEAYLENERAAKELKEKLEAQFAAEREAFQKNMMDKNNRIALLDRQLAQNEMDAANSAPAITVEPHAEEKDDIIQKLRAEQARLEKELCTSRQLFEEQAEKLRQVETQAAQASLPADTSDAASASASASASAIASIADPSDHPLSRQASTIESARIVELQSELSLTEAHLRQKALEVENASHSWFRIQKKLQGVLALVPNEFVPAHLQPLKSADLTNLNEAWAVDLQEQAHPAEAKELQGHKEARITGKEKQDECKLDWGLGTIIQDMNREVTSLRQQLQAAQHAAKVAEASRAASKTVQQAAPAPAQQMQQPITLTALVADDQTAVIATLRRDLDEKTKEVQRLLVLVEELRQRVVNMAAVSAQEGPIDAVELMERAGLRALARARGEKQVKKIFERLWDDAKLRVRQKEELQRFRIAALETTDFRAAYTKELKDMYLGPLSWEVPAEANRSQLDFLMEDFDYQALPRPDESPHTDKLLRYITKSANESGSKVVVSKDKKFGRPNTHHVARRLSEQPMVTNDSPPKVKTKTIFQKSNKLEEQVEKFKSENEELRRALSKRKLPGAFGQYLESLRDSVDPDARGITDE